jgi:hypothetical protein
MNLKFSILFTVTFFIISTGMSYGQENQPQKKGAYFGFGGGVGDSFNYSRHNVGAAVNISFGAVTRGNQTLGVEFDAYFGHNLNLAAPVTVYINKNQYFKVGPCVSRVGHDYANYENGFGFVLGGGAEFEPAFTGKDSFKSIIINANYIFQFIGDRNSSYFSLSAGIRFSSDR